VSMKGFRRRAGALASCALIWQIVALIFVPAAACCQARASTAAEPMANCPMQHPATSPECPMHHIAVRHDCHCPTLSCAQTDQGFLALLGPIGVLPDPPSTFALLPAGDAVQVVTAATLSLASAPLSPPPRLIVLL
jgi:hypothetical protein